MDLFGCLWNIFVFRLVAYVAAVYAFCKIYTYFVQGAQFTRKIRCDGKVILITGANTGIGKWTAFDLASRGAKVIIACRDETRGKLARDEIEKVSGNKNVHFMQLDLSSFQNIRDFAKKFIAQEERLDILINNAGVMGCPKGKTVDGVETTLGINHMGHFLLTHLLLDLLKKSTPSRIITIASKAHYFIDINKDDLYLDKSYNSLEAYAQSKLANMLFTRELAYRLKGTGVSAFSLHPGIIHTDLSRHLESGKLQFLWPHLIHPLLHYILKTPKSGAQTTIYAALEPGIEHQSGAYFSNCTLGFQTKEAQNDETARWLWKVSEEVTGISDTTK